MQAVFYDRQFNAAGYLGGLFEVKSMDWGLPGGSKVAVLRMAVQDLESELARAVESLRFGVDIHDDAGEVVWNGYVHEVEIRWERLRLEVSLDGFANRVAVRYVDLKPKAAWMREDSLTDFVEDGVSAARYGVKEWIGYLPSGTPEMAGAAALSWLKEKAVPEKKARFEAKNEKEVYLHCRGWWETLGWQYYSQTDGFVGHLEEGTKEQTLGNTSTYTKVAQRFIVPANGLRTAEAWVRIAAEESPTDDLVVQVVADVSGNPGGTVQASGSAAGSILTGGFNWVRFALSGADLVGGDPYWLVVSRSGSVSGTNYYLLQLDRGIGYADGVMKTWNGSSWTQRVGDINFAVLGSEETTLQIGRMVEKSGQFMRGVRVLDASGVQHLLWRPLQRTCREEIEELLAVGTSNGKKLDAMVDARRNVVVWEREESNGWELDELGF